MGDESKNSQDPRIKEIVIDTIKRYITVNPVYSVSDLKRIVGQYYPRRLATGSTFDYIYNRIIDELKSKLPKKQVVSLRRAEILHEQELRTHGEADHLTGLYHRDIFKARLEERVKGTPKWTLGFIDIDKFKQCNDIYGHKSGDDVLIALSNALNQKLRNENLSSNSKLLSDQSLLCRWGGEEIVVAYSGPEEDFKIYMSDVQNSFRGYVTKLLDTDKSGFKGNISVGYVPFDTSSNFDFSQIVEQADTAMYKAKDIGGNQIVKYDPSMNKISK